MTTDRRRYLREPRFLRLEYEWNDEPSVGITTNVSEGGAFVNVRDFPPIGSVIEMRHQAIDDLAEVTFTAIVHRIVDPQRRISMVPGVGVRWLLATCADGAEALRVALVQLLSTDTVEVIEDDDGRGIWRPSPLDVEAIGHRVASIDRLKKDLLRIDDVRPALDRTLGPLPRVGDDLERRNTLRRSSGVQVTCFVNGVSVAGSVINLSVRGMWVETTDPLPQPGGVLTVRYPISEDGRDVRWARLVGVVVRASDGDNPGFGVEIISVDNQGAPDLFESHVKSLFKERKKGGVRMRIRSNILPFPR